MAQYCNNQKFLEAIIEYKEKKKINPSAPIPDYAVKCLMLIANRFARKPNFVNYSYKDDMISAALENCVKYFNNFDPEKSNNPFAYFTQICYHAFIGVISMEKKQSKIKSDLVFDPETELQTEDA